MPRLPAQIRQAVSAELTALGFPPARIAAVLSNRENRSTTNGHGAFFVSAEVYGHCVVRLAQLLSLNPISGAPQTPVHALLQRLLQQAVHYNDVENDCLAYVKRRTIVELIKVADREYQDLVSHHGRGVYRVCLRTLELFREVLGSRFPACLGLWITPDEAWERFWRNVARSVTIDDSRLCRPEVIFTTFATFYDRSQIDVLLGQWPEGVAGTLADIMHYVLEPIVSSPPIRKIYIDLFLRRTGLTGDKPLRGADLVAACELGGRSQGAKHMCALLEQALKGERCVDELTAFAQVCSAACQAGWKECLASYQRPRPRLDRFNLESSVSELLTHVSYERTIRALDKSGIRTVRQLCQRGESVLRWVVKVDRIAVQGIRQNLKKLDLDLGMGSVELERWERERDT